MKAIIKNRYELIRPEDVDKVFLVHTGKEFKEIKITSITNKKGNDKGGRVGKKFGEFAITKLPAI